MNIASMFRLAENVSKLSTHRRCKLGSVIVSKGNPVSFGANKGKTHPDAPFSGLHAEAVALKNAGNKNLKGCSIFVYRVKKDGTIGMAKPCPHCEKLLRDAGIKTVYYSTNQKDGFPFFEVEIYD